MNVPERVSIELTRRCAKACHFCYNNSGPDAQGAWRPDEVISFVRNIAAHGTKAVSLGGGEPLEYESLEEIFAALRGVVFLSMTTNGLCLDAQWNRIAALAPDKVHVSIHFPGREREVTRVIRQVLLLRSMGITAGVNLLVRADRLDRCRAAVRRLHEAGIRNDAIVYLPMRGPIDLTPSPMALVDLAGGPFQSMTCLSGCGRSPRFCSIDARKRVAHCSYTETRRALAALDARSLHDALSGLGLAFCGVA